MTSRYERLKAQRRMQRRIMLVVEERRIALAAKPESRALAAKPESHAEPKPDPEATVEIPAQAAARAIGRVAVTS